jgi:hypothetical protein
VRKGWKAANAKATIVTNATRGQTTLPLPLLPSGMLGCQNTCGNKRTQLLAEAAANSSSSKQQQK